MRASYRQGLAAGAAVLGLLIAAPAIGAAGSHDRGGQPPPGTVDHSGVNPARVPVQPPAGTVAIHRAHPAPVPKQPVNRHPVQSSGFKAGLQLRHSKHDKGVKGLRPTKDHGKKNLPVQKG